MAVGPLELEGIAANGRYLLQAQIRLGRMANNSGVRRLAHEGVAAFTANARADSPQAIKGISAFVAVIPGYKEAFLVSVGRYISWSGQSW
jgi:hypothetical protein